MTRILRLIYAFWCSIGAIRPILCWCAEEPNQTNIHSTMARTGSTLQLHSTACKVLRCQCLKQLDYRLLRPEYGNCNLCWRACFRWDRTCCISLMSQKAIKRGQQFTVIPLGQRSTFLPWCYIRLTFAIYITYTFQCIVWSMWHMQRTRLTIKWTCSRNKTFSNTYFCQPKV